MPPHEGRNALLAAAATTQALHTLPQFPEAVTRVNVGRLIAGTASNVVPDRAVLDCELRADSDDVLEQVAERATSVIRGAAAMQGVDTHVTVTGSANTGRSDPELTECLRTAAAGVEGVDDIRTSTQMTASDDATVLMADVQAHGSLAAYAVVGASSPAPHHHPTFDIDESALSIAVDWLEQLVHAQAGDEVAES